MLQRLIFLLLLFLGLRAFPQVTPNIGFDDGSFTNWQCWTGSVKTGTPVLNAGYPVPGRHTIIDSQHPPGSFDAYGQFPMYSPNGSRYSLLLGNEEGGSQAERVSYTFQVPQTGEYTVIFDYAVVLENPDHSPEQQPRFTARVYNVSDNTYLDCPSFDFAAGSGLPGFVLSTQFTGDGEVYYKPWSKATIDLKGYPGKIMRIEFTTNDCIPGKHFGYAYLDVENTDIITAITGNAYCNSQPTVTLSGPIGFASYTWYNDDKSKVLGNNRIITMPAPKDNTPYILHIEPFNGVGCPDDLHTVVNKINADFDLALHAQQTCPGVTVDLTMPVITAGSINVKYLDYFTDAGGINELANPKAVGPGVYYIRGMNADGCAEIKPVNVTLYEVETFTTTNPAPVTFPTPIDLSATFTPKAGYKYIYLSNPKSASPITDYTHITRAGTYYIKAISIDGCETVSPVKVTVNPPPAIVTNAPNAFTPNGDGINDLFKFSATGYYTFLDLKIYNRNGTLVFNSKSADIPWNGTYNGQNLPAGVYYWVFEGLDDYSLTKINRGGSVTIIR